MDGKADKRTDGELVAAVNGGDWGAFDVLYYRYRDWTFRLGWRFCGDENDAQDVVQEVFVYLAGKLRTGLELRAGMMTLLYPAVKHTALAIKRKRGRFREMPEDWEVEGGGRVGEKRNKGEGQKGGNRRELEVVLGELSEGQREVLLMRFVDEMTLEEIGGALGLPVGTVKSRLHYALEVLREDEGLRRYFEE